MLQWLGAELSCSRLGFRTLPPTSFMVFVYARYIDVYTVGTVYIQYVKLHTVAELKAAKQYG